jgi:hypothetical protein
LVDVARVECLSGDEAATALAELSALQAALVARLPSAKAQPNPEARDVALDRLLTAEEVSARFKRSKDWVYRRAKKWPFTVREGRKTVRFSERGLAEHLKNGGLDD